MPPASSLPTYPSFHNADSAPSIPSSSAPGMLAPSPNAGSERTHLLGPMNVSESNPKDVFFAFQSADGGVSDAVMGEANNEGTPQGANDQDTFQTSDDDGSYIPGAGSRNEDTSDSADDDDLDYMNVDPSDESESSFEFFVQSDSSSDSTSTRDSPDRSEDRNSHRPFEGGSEESAQEPKNGPLHPAEEGTPSSPSLSLEQDSEKQRASSPSPGDWPKNFDSHTSERSSEEKAEVHKNVSNNESMCSAREVSPQSQLPGQNSEQNKQLALPPSPARPPIGSGQELPKSSPQAEPEISPPKPSDSQSSLENELPDVPLHFLLQTQAPYETSFNES
jgi:hypothetical protein